jgi:hypothetical protein
MPENTAAVATICSLLLAALPAQVPVIFGTGIFVVSCGMLDYSDINRTPDSGSQRTMGRL